MYILYYMFRFALFHAVDSIIICIMNVCLKKPVQLPFENRLAFWLIYVNTHTQTDTKPKRNIFQTCANFHAQTILRIRAEPRAIAVCSSPSPATNMVN